MSYAENALTDFMAISSLGKTKLSIAVQISSCTLASTVAIILSTSVLTMPELLLSNVCTSYREPSTGADMFALFDISFLPV